MIKQPFNPAYGSNQILSVGATSDAATIDAGRYSKQVRIVNIGVNIAHVRLYNAADGAQEATEADFPVPGGMSSTITKDQRHDTLAHISADGTTLHVMLGEGF